MNEGESRVGSKGSALEVDGPGELGTSVWCRAIILVDWSVWRAPRVSYGRG